MSVSEATTIVRQSLALVDNDSFNARHSQLLEQFDAAQKNLVEDPTPAHLATTKKLCQSLISVIKHEHGVHHKSELEKELCHVDRVLEKVFSKIII